MITVDVSYPFEKTLFNDTIEPPLLYSYTDWLRLCASQLHPISSTALASERVLGNRGGAPQGEPSEWK